MSPTPPPRRLQPGDYVWHRVRCGPGHQQPGVVTGPGWPGTEETMVRAGQLLTRLGDTCTPDHVGPIITPPGTTDRYCLTCQAEPVTTPTNPPPDPNHENPNTPHPTTNPQEPTP